MRYFTAFVEFLKSRDHHRRRVGVARQAVRMKIIHAVYAAKEHRAILALAKCAGVKHIALQAIRQIVVGKSFGLGIEARQTLAGANPEIARVISAQCRHMIVAQAIRVIFIITESFKAVAALIKFLQPARCPNPKRTAAVLANRRNNSSVHEILCLEIRQVKFEALRRFVKQIQSAGGADPDALGAIFINRKDIIMAQAQGPFFAEKKVRELGLLGEQLFEADIIHADPQNAGAILTDGRDRIRALPARRRRVIEEANEPGFFALQEIQAAIRSDPQTAAAILENNIDAVSAQAVRISGIMVIWHKFSFSQIKSVQSVSSADPKRAAALLKNGAHTMMAQAFGIGRIMAIADEAVILAIKSTEATAGRSHPQCSGFIRVQRADSVVAQAGEVGRIMPIACECLRAFIEFAESVARSHPQYILRNRISRE